MQSFENTNLIKLKSSPKADHNNFGQYVMLYMRWLGVFSQKNLEIGLAAAVSGRLRILGLF